MTIIDERPVQESEADLGPAIRPELEHALRREVERALQPVLADFRTQSVRAVRQQVDRAHLETREEGHQEDTPSAGRDREVRSSMTWRGGREPRPVDSAMARPADEPSAPSDQSVVSEVTGPAAHIVEDRGTQWIKSRLEDGRATLCSTRVREGVRASIERTFFPLLEAGLELVPSESARRTLEQESERALDEFVRDALEHFCSERILADLQRHAEAALLALVRLDIAATVREIWEAVRALLRAILAAVQDQWQRLLHLMLHVLLKATQEMVGTIVKDGLAAIVAAPVEEIEEKAGEAKESIEDHLTDVRDRLAERIETLQERVKEEVEQVKERVAEGIKSAVEGGTDSDTFGRPPTGRPPSLRSPSGRPPSGRPPSGRPPTGRPPSLTRRRA